MLFALHLVDFGVLLLFVAAVLAIGFYFRFGQQTSLDFFVAGRSMNWFPAGLSIAMALLSGLTFTAIPGEAYWAGLKLLLMPIAIWLAAPFLLWIFLPLCRGLQLCSVYEYLELRFDSTTRLVAALMFVGWRLLWMGGMLYACCQLVTVAAIVDIPLSVLIVFTGLLTTTYTFLGGMKAVIWTDVVKVFAVSAGILATIGSAWWQLKGGPSRVWEVASTLGRMESIDSQFSWTSDWTVWGIVPHFVLSVLIFYVADQITAQRYLATRSLRDAQRSFLVNCVTVSMLMLGLVYVGLCFVAFYHDHASQLRTKWIVNVDGDTRRSLTYADRDRMLGKPMTTTDSPPLLEWNDPADDVTAESVERLIAEQRLLHPNRKTPFENAKELFDEANPEQLDNTKLATRHPPKGSLMKGEIVLNTKAKNELVPWFAATQLPFGIAGFVVVGFAAAAMSALDSGLNAICCLLIFDFHRRYGWGRAWLARGLNKSVNELTETDERRLGQRLILVVGIAATLLSLMVARIEDVFSLMLGVATTFGTSLLGVFLLGICTRRATASGALLGLAFGSLFTIWLSVANSHMAWLWPFEQRFASIWQVTFGTLFTFVFGYVASLVWGIKKARGELRGLVVGCGRLGTRQIASGLGGESGGIRLWNSSRR